MSTRMRQRVPTRSHTWCTTMRRKLREAIERAGPNGVIEMHFDPCEVICSLMLEERRRSALWLRRTEGTLNGLGESAIRVLGACSFERP